MNAIDELIAKLNNCKRAAIFCHTRPDGDALGSGLALLTLLRSMNKTAHMACEDAPPKKFSFIAEMANVKTQIPDCDYDLMIAVDCADVTRLGCFSKRFSRFKGETVNIDHHISNDNFAKFNHVEICCATCEIIANLFKAAKLELTENIANLLMLGLITDSGNFTHTDVTAKTFKTAAYLREHGADVNKINYYMFQSQPKERALTYGKVMSKMRFALESKLAIIVISAEDMEYYNMDKSLSEGFVDFPLTVDSVEVAISLLESGKEQYKASLRSKGKVNVNQIASLFGGGGHVLASGCMLFGTLEDTVERLTEAVKRHI